MADSRRKCRHFTHDPILSLNASYQQISRYEVSGIRNLHFQRYLLI
jgi:hypothetical protein